MTTLNSNEIEIAEIQKKLSGLGWQWRESVFNDGYPDNCNIVFTKSKDPCYLINNPLGDCGWGRYSRIRAWKQAFEALKL